MGSTTKSRLSLGSDDIDAIVPINATFLTVAEIQRMLVTIRSGGVIVNISDCGMCLNGLPVPIAVKTIDALSRDDRTARVLSVSGPPMAMQWIDMSTVDMRLAGRWPGPLTVVAKVRKGVKVPELRTTACDIGMLLRGKSGVDPKQVTMGARLSMSLFESGLVAGTGLPLISAVLPGPDGTPIKTTDEAIDVLKDLISTGCVPRVPLLVVKPRKVTFPHNIPSTVVESTKTEPSILHRDGPMYSARDIAIIERTPMPGEWDAT